MKSGFKLSSHPFLSTLCSYKLACGMVGSEQPMHSAAARTLCQQCERWAVAKRKWWSLLHNDRAAVCDIGDEAESSKFLESSSAAPFLTSSYSRELMKMKTHWVSVSASQNQSSPGIIFFFSALIATFYSFWVTAWIPRTVMQTQPL